MIQISSKMILKYSDVQTKKYNSGANFLIKEGGGGTNGALVV